MKNVFAVAAMEEVKERMAQLRPDSERLWGKMNAAQSLAHCSTAMDMAIGKDISAANLDWTAAGAIGEEVVDRERDTDAPQCDNRDVTSRIVSPLRN